MKIVFLDRGTFSPQTTLRQPQFSHEMLLHESTSADEVAQRVADADIVVTNKVKLPAGVIAHAKKLRLVRAQRRIGLAALSAREAQPSVVATSGDTERLAH